jgi:mannose-6-phosphate isomerase-like protein (cupin superfamily)
MQVVNLAEKFSLFTETWSPKIIGELNGQHVKLARLKGEFVWHSHKDEDEMFLIIQGSLVIQFRDKTVTLHPGEMIIIPRGVEHNPISDEEVLLMLFEPAQTKHTGEVVHELTQTVLEKI